MRTLVTGSASLLGHALTKDLLPKGHPLRPLAFLLWKLRIDVRKAERELGLVPMPLAGGVKPTITFLRAEGLVQ